MESTTSDVRVLAGLNLVVVVVILVEVEIVVTFKEEEEEEDQEDLGSRIRFIRNLSSSCEMEGRTAPCTPLFTPLLFLKLQLACVVSLLLESRPLHGLAPRNVPARFLYTSVPFRHHHHHHYHQYQYQHYQQPPPLRVPVTSTTNSPLPPNAKSCRNL
ncbi:hypothetical protein M0802_011264 [Mischocyttarus mexicanus]|nr:hypothetical protein M0802_011264 [Mischocyttarus mexicanus]